MTEANVDDLTLLFGGRKLEDNMMLSTYLQADGMTILLRMPVREGGVARQISLHAREDVDQEAPQADDEQNSGVYALSAS